MARESKRAYLTVLLVLSLGGCGGDNPGGSSTTKNTPDAGKPDATCVAGSADCSCKEGNRCDDGLACVEQKCKSGKVVAAGITPASARACEILFDEDTTQIGSISFEGGAKGKMVRQAPNVGVSFISTEDKSLPAGFMKLNLSGTGSPKVKAIHCVDGAGSPVAEAKLNL